MIIKENLEQINSGPNKLELNLCRESGKNYTDLYSTLLETLKGVEYVDSRLNNLSSRF